VDRDREVWGRRAAKPLVEHGAIGPQAGPAWLRDTRRPAAWILEQLDPDDSSVDGTSILVPTNPEVGEWREALLAAGIGSVSLEQYAGRHVPRVKVGTFHRAKGLEFERVYIPNLDAGRPRQGLDEDGLVREGSLLYVAVSRARDRLPLSYRSEPSMFLEPVRPYCAEERP
jgi:superfamily I DNA/RNA helicase